MVGVSVKCIILFKLIINKEYYIMVLTVRKGKVNRHEKITQVLLSGKPVSPDEIATVFQGTDQEAVLYRLSTNIYNIRKDGGIVKVIKDGKKVKAYQLVNFTEFDTNGRYIGKQSTPTPVATPVSPVASITSPTETVTV
jgi:hypothetical protein